MRRASAKPAAAYRRILARNDTLQKFVPRLDVMSCSTITPAAFIGNHPADSPVQRGFWKNNLIRDAN
jgi:hypothetical protein